MEPTMKGVIFILFLTNLADENLVSSLEVSSQIDFDSGENQQQSSNSSALKVIVNLNDDAEQIVTSKSSELMSNLVKDSVRTEDSKRRRSHFREDDSTSQPLIINNVHIVVNGNETKPGVNSCKDGICDVTVSSKPDGAGNIVTDVHLSIVTKLNTNHPVGDIPIFDGLRGVENAYDPPPDFHLLNDPRPRPHFYNNIPQIQTHRQDSAEPWYQGRVGFQRPQNTWYYHGPRERTDRRFQSHGGWVPIKPKVDDKIEPPLSKTQPSDD